jgi:hypothetical protein
MRWSWASIGAVIGIGAAALVGAVVLGKAVVGSNEPSSQAEYQQLVVMERDRIDFALARIGGSQSPEELVTRIDEAAAVVGAAGEEVADTNPPNELASQNDGLVRTLQAFSAELEGTAATLRDPTFEDSLRGLNSLSFKQWDELNRVFAGLRSDGIEVEPLARH